MAHLGQLNIGQGNTVTNPLGLVLITGLMLAGCNQSINSIAPNRPPNALPSAPVDTVSSGQLPPIGGEQQATQDPDQLPQEPVAATSPTTPDNPQVQTATAENEPNKSTREITREGMAGSWKVPTDGGNCNIILAFTKWSGGYRAATRHCNSAEIQSVNAWDVKDQSVVLVDQSGNMVARLFASNEGRYDGRTNGGQAIAFTR